MRVRGDGVPDDAQIAHAEDPLDPLQGHHHHRALGEEVGQDLDAALRHKILDLPAATAAQQEEGGAGTQKTGQKTGRATKTKNVSRRVGYLSVGGERRGARSIFFLIRGQAVFKSTLKNTFKSRYTF